MQHSFRERMSKAASFSAILFGIATLAAGTRVLLGANPGYGVFLPLLYFNTIMGVAYVVVGVISLKRRKLGTHAAAMICVLNLGALGAILYLYEPDGVIAETSVQAMMLRTLVWLALFAILVAANRSSINKNAD